MQPNWAEENNFENMPVSISMGMWGKEKYKKITATQPLVTKRVYFALNVYICVRQKMGRMWITDDHEWTIYIHGLTQPHNANVWTVARLGHHRFIHNIFAVHLTSYYSMFYSMNP